ncbi:MAG: S8 family serine peptidase [Henriciella sp.]|nr:S8 family serine peptidase [Henriciella sp.]
MVIAIALLLTGAPFLAEPAADAQARERIERIDRAARLRERAADRSRDRAITDRTIADRSRDRAITDRALADRVIERAVLIPQDTDTIQDIRTIETEATHAGTDTLIVLSERGYPYRRGEVLALNISDRALDLARANGFTVARQRDLGYGNTLTVLRASQFDSPAAIIVKLQALDPDGLYTPNHVFAPSAPQHTEAETSAAIAGPRHLAKTSRRVGMIDGLPDIAHPLLGDMLDTVRNFTDAPDQVSQHGTAVALRMQHAQTLYAGNTDINLYAAGVLSGTDAQSAPADALAAAIAWQRSNKTEILNISLAGPPNDIIEAMIKAYQSDGGLVVAAVGNGGPLSGNIFPAAYPDVIGVTAVDTSGAVYPLATRGVHVDLAAQGVSLSLPGRSTPLSGTSFAAPVVSIWLLTVGRDATKRPMLYIDHGEPGRDDTFGWGETRRPPPVVLKASMNAPPF